MLIFFDHHAVAPPALQGGDVTRSHNSHKHPWSAWPRRRRFSFYPRSLTQLVSAGLLLIVLLLVTALAIAGLYVEKATSEGQQAVILSTEAVQHSLALADLLKDMERSARIYQVMGNESLLANYAQLRQKLSDTAATLAALEFNLKIKNTTHVLLQKEHQAFTELATKGPGPEQVANTIKIFSELRDIAATLIAHNSQSIKTRVKEMKDTAASTRRILYWEAVIALAMVIAATLWIIPPLSRYIRDLDRSIVQLGNGNLDKHIALKGPNDIRELGARLEWLRQQLQLLEDRKQHFLQHFSHELKTPLSSLREGTSLLSDGVMGKLNDEQQKIAVILQRNCVNLQQQIDGLLKYSVSMQPFQRFDYQTLQLDEQVLGVIKEQQLQIHAKDISVITALNIVSIYADTAQITTVIDNLISNAVKFSPFGGRIHIALHTDGQWAVIEIADEGPGISDSEHDRIFEAFYKSPSTMTENTEGSGLGLSIAKQISSAHGGNIEVINSNKGARLRLILPLQPGQA